MEYLPEQIDIEFQQTTLYQYNSNPSPIKYVTVKSIYVISDNLNYEKPYKDSNTRYTINNLRSNGDGHKITSIFIAAFNN